MFWDFVYDVTKTRESFNCIAEPGDRQEIYSVGNYHYHWRLQRAICLKLYNKTSRNIPVSQNGFQTHQISVEVNYFNQSYNLKLSSQNNKNKSKTSTTTNCSGPPWAFK